MIPLQADHPIQSRRSIN